MYLTKNLELSIVSSTDQQIAIFGPESLRTDDNNDKRGMQNRPSMLTNRCPLQIRYKSIRQLVWRTWHHRLEFQCLFLQHLTAVFGVSGTLYLILCNTMLNSTWYGTILTWSLPDTVQYNVKLYLIQYNAVLNFTWYSTILSWTLSDIVQCCVKRLVNSTWYSTIPC